MVRVLKENVKLIHPKDICCSHCSSNSVLIVVYGRIYCLPCLKAWQADIAKGIVKALSG